MKEKKNKLNTTKLNVNAKEWVPFDLQPKKYLQALKSQNTSVPITFSRSVRNDDVDDTSSSSTVTTTTSSSFSKSKNIVVKSLSITKRSKMNELLWEEKARVFSEKEKEKVKLQKQQAEMNIKTKTNLHVWNSILRMKPQYDNEPQYSVGNNIDRIDNDIQNDSKLQEEEVNYSIDEQWQAIITGDESLLPYLGKHFDWHSERDGKNALHLASFYAHKKFLIQALRFGISAKTKTRDKKQTALHLLALNKTNLEDRLECAQILIHNGGECSTRDRVGDSVIHICATKGFHQLLHCLIHHSKRHHLRFDDLNCNKQSPLMIVVSMPASYKYLECINLFLKGGATVDEAFIEAFTKGNAKAVGKIINSNNAIFGNHCTGPDRERWKQLLPLALLKDDMGLMTILVDARIINDDLLTSDNDWIGVVLKHFHRKSPLISIHDIKNKYPSFSYSQYSAFSSLRSIGSHDLMTFALFLGHIEGFRILSKHKDTVNWRTALHAALCSPCPHKAVYALNDLAIGSIKRRDDRGYTSSFFSSSDVHMLNFPLGRLVNGVFRRPVNNKEDEIVPILVNCFSMTLKCILEERQKQKEKKMEKSDGSSCSGGGSEFDRFLEAIVAVISYCPPSTSTFRLMHSFRSSCLRHSTKSKENNLELTQKHRGIERERRIHEREKGKWTGEGKGRVLEREKEVNAPETLFDLSSKAIMNSILYPIDGGGECSSWDVLYTVDRYRHCKEGQDICFDTIRDIAAEKCLLDININNIITYENEDDGEDDEEDKGTGEGVKRGGDESHRTEQSLEQAKQLAKDVLEMCLPIDEWIA